MASASRIDSQIAGNLEGGARHSSGAIAREYFDDEHFMQIAAGSCWLFSRQRLRSTLSVTDPQNYTTRPH
jgi:hypothetical protein